MTTAAIAAMLRHSGPVKAPRTRRRSDDLRFARMSELRLLCALGSERRPAARPGALTHLSRQAHLGDDAGTDRDGRGGLGIGLPHDVVAGRKAAEDRREHRSRLRRAFVHTGVDSMPVAVLATDLDLAAAET